ncbi:MAG: DUF1178 family protein [Pseudomonadota bacterium]
MIRYDLCCADCGAEFDAWFASSSAFDDQAAKGLVRCTVCDGSRVAKQIMAPAVRSTKTPAPDTAALAKAIEQARNFIESTHDYVGSDFADEAKAMHYGEIEQRPIWGEVTAVEREELEDEGVAAAPLPAPLTPKTPDDQSEVH